MIVLVLVIPPGLAATLVFRYVLTSLSTVWGIAKTALKKSGDRMPPVGLPLSSSPRRLVRCT